MGYTSRVVSAGMSTYDIQSGQEQWVGALSGYQSFSVQNHKAKLYRFNICLEAVL